MGASRSARGRLLLWSCFCPVAGASSGAHKIGPCRQRARNPTARQGARADERSLCSPTRVAARPLRCSPTLSESRPLNRTPDPGSHSLTPGCCADQVECPDPAGRTLQLHEPPKRSVPLTADVFSGSTGLVEQIDVSRAGRVEPGGQQRKPVRNLDDSGQARRAGSPFRTSAAVPTTSSSTRFVLLLRITNRLGPCRHSLAALWTAASATCAQADFPSSGKAPRTPRDTRRAQMDARRQSRPEA